MPAGGKKNRVGTVVESGGFLPRLFPALFGGMLGLALLKFGNPVILDKLVVRPGDFFEWALSPWPVSIGYWLVGMVALVGIVSRAWKGTKFSVLALLPLLWLGWQFISATQTVNAELTGAVLRQFTACVVCFYLGYFVLGNVGAMSWFWLGLLCGFGLVLWQGLGQHFGGLEQARIHFWTYVYPTMERPMPELLERMSSNRIFSTLFYPNALAGAILLCLPPLLAFVWGLERLFTPAARIFLLTVLGAAALGCMVWSGSKAGWLLALLLGLLALLRLPFARRLKVALVVGLLAAGLVGFAVRYSAYFQRGATSLGARLDYWRAAVATARANPVFGTGPGTFALAYAKVKRPESEMSRLVHNDYLQQASDSGLPGAAAYLGFIVAVLSASWWRVGAHSGRCCRPDETPAGATCLRSGTTEDWQAFSAWLGAAGWALQGLVEFGLYIPALAWPAFAILGWLLSRCRAGR